MNALALADLQHDLAAGVPARDPGERLARLLQWQRRVWQHARLHAVDPARLLRQRCSHRSHPVTIAGRFPDRGRFVSTVADKGKGLPPGGRGGIRARRLSTVNEEARHASERTGQRHARPRP